MFNYRICILSVAATLLFSAAVSNAADLDKQLVGEWQGQRDAGSKCSFLAWKLNRSADRKFEITFYSNPNKTEVAGREHGIWWVDSKKYFTQTEGVPTPDGYSYSFINQDTVHYAVLTRDPSADCKDDYEFTDHRVVGK
jgi:hypothetical protein